jgi:putative phosphoribosyl transferase
LFDSLKNKFQLRFKNRVFAAKILTGSLEDSLRKMKIDKKKDILLILGVPRGGVIVADVVATGLPYKSEFDIVIPRKLAAPHNQEIAIGAVMEDGALFLKDEIINELEIDDEYIGKEKEKQLEEIKRRNSLYRNLGEEGSIAHKIKDKIVVLVDDGAATGATLIAAARYIMKLSPKKLVIAIPVTSKDTLETLKRECDMVVTGTTPSSSTFKTVGQYYQEFKQVEDSQVIEICQKRKMTIG